MNSIYGFMKDKIMLLPMIDRDDNVYRWHGTKIIIQRSIFNEINYNMWRLFNESLKTIDADGVRLLQTYFERFEVPKELVRKITNLLGEENLKFEYREYNYGLK